MEHVHFPRRRRDEARNVGIIDHNRARPGIHRVGTSELSYRVIDAILIRQPQLRRKVFRVFRQVCTQRIHSGLARPNVRLGESGSPPTKSVHGNLAGIKKTD